MSTPIKLSAKTAAEVADRYGVDLVFELEHIMNLQDPREVAKFYLLQHERFLAEK